MRKIRSGNKINSFSLETVWKKSWERARLIYKSILNKNEFDNEKKNRFHGRSTDFGASRFM